MGMTNTAMKHRKTATIMSMTMFTRPITIPMSGWTRSTPSPWCVGS